MDSDKKNMERVLSTFGELFESEGKRFWLLRGGKDKVRSVYSLDEKKGYFGGELTEDGAHRLEIRSIEDVSFVCHSERRNKSRPIRHRRNLLGDELSDSNYSPPPPETYGYNTLFSECGIFVEGKEEDISIDNLAKELSHKLKNDMTYRLIQEWLKKNRGVVTKFPADILDTFSETNIITRLSDCFGTTYEFTTDKLMGFTKLVDDGIEFDLQEKGVSRSDCTGEYRDFFKQLTYITTEVFNGRSIELACYFGLNSESLFSGLIDDLISRRKSNEDRYDEEAPRHTQLKMEYIVKTWLQLTDALISTKKDKLSLSESIDYLFYTLDEENEGKLKQLLDMNNALKKSERRPVKEILEWSTLTSPGFALVWYLGGGASGKVFQVYDSHLKRERALKIIQGNVSVKEAELMAKLEDNPHPNFPVIYGAGDHIAKYAGKPVYAILMNYIDGENIDRKFKFDKVVDYSCQIFDAISHLRKLGIFHRDLRPENIKVNKQGLVKILDFGIAEDEVEAEPVNNRRYGGPNDIFSLGLIMYKMATGEHLILSRQEERYRKLSTDSYAEALAEMKTSLFDDRGEITVKYAGKIAEKLPIELQKVIRDCISINKSNETEQISFIENTMTQLKVSITSVEDILFLLGGM